MHVPETSCPGLEHRFAARQLLGLAKVLDFTDASARTAAVGLVRSQLLWGYSYREDSAMALQDQEAEAMEVSLGGSHAWAQAVAELAAEVYRGNSDQLHHVSPAQPSGEWHWLVTTFHLENTRGPMGHQSCLRSF